MENKPEFTKELLEEYLKDVFYKRVGEKKPIKYAQKREDGNWYNQDGELMDKSELWPLRAFL